MNTFNNVYRSVLSDFTRKFGVARIDSKLSNNAQNLESRSVFVIHPSPNEAKSGIDCSMELWRAMHHLDGLYSFEIWYQDQLSFVITVNDSNVDKFHDLFLGYFPESRTVEVEQPHPEIKVGDYIAGAEICLQNDYFLPILNPFGAENMQGDPYENIIKQIKTISSVSQAVIQMVFTPTGEDWSERMYIPINPLWSINEGIELQMPLIPKLLNPADIANVQLDKSEQGAMNAIKYHGNEKAYYASIKILAISDSPATSIRDAKTIASSFTEAYTDSIIGQGFTSVGVPGRDLPRFLGRIKDRTAETRREVFGPIKRKPLVLTIPELTSVAHLPSPIEHDKYHYDFY